VTYRPVNLIEVRCWGSTVGAVALDPSTGFYAFEYDPGWVRRRIELSPIMLPATNRVFVFPDLDPGTYQRLPAMLADSLPDAFGNALTNAYLAGEGVPVEQITSLDRLAYLGRRGIGALEFRPVRGPQVRRSTAIELSEIVLAARATLSGHLDTEAGITDALAQLIAVGTSAGGARAKAVIALNPATDEIRSGQVPADPGFEHWLLKLDGVGGDQDLGVPRHYGRIEFAYYRMAVAAGITMTECRLLEEGGWAHFLTRRFDRRPDGGKVHVQSLCALAHMDYRIIGAHDYAQLFATIDRLGLEPSSRSEAYRRMVFNVAAANCDDHTKNFAFLLAEDGAWQLSPAYDVTHAHAPLSKWTRQHLMAVNGKTTGIDRHDLAEVGDRFAVPGASRIVDEVLHAVARWPTFAREALIPPDTATLVSEHIATWSTALEPRARRRRRT